MVKHIDSSLIMPMPTLRAEYPGRLRPSPSVRRQSFTAVVYAADGTRFIATEPSAHAIVARVVSYIEARCDHVLWPADAKQVRAFIEGGNLHAAIATYFESVGEKWDEERLALEGYAIPADG